MPRFRKRDQDPGAAIEGGLAGATCGAELPSTPNVSIHLGWLNGAATYSPGVGYWIHFKSDPPLGDDAMAQLLRELADDAE